MNNRISVNGVELPHQVGDSVYRLTFGEDGFTPQITEIPNAVKKIVITDNFIRCIGSYDRPIHNNPTTGFWTREEAQKWFDSVKPNKFSITEKRNVYHVLGDGCLGYVEVERMIVRGGRIEYLIANSMMGFTEDDIGKTVFFAEEEARNVLRRTGDYSKTTNRNNKFAAQLLANEIEQFMFERGEYDLHLEDRIRWLKTDDRKGNAGYIRDEILKNNIGFLTEYLTSEISSMCKDDELIPKAEKLIEELKGVIL